MDKAETIENSFVEVDIHVNLGFTVLDNLEGRYLVSEILG